MLRALGRWLQPATRSELNALRRSFGSVKQYFFNELRRGRALERHCAGRVGLKLNLGCGEIVKPGWVNVDGNPKTSDVFYFDFRNKLPIADGSVRHVHSEAFFEHLEYDDVAALLREISRVLVPNGTARIIVPDLEKYASAYSRNDQAYFEQLPFLGGAAEKLETKGIICNQMFRMGGGHKFAWDFETFDHVARANGFSSCLWSEQNDIPAELNIDGSESWRPHESLYINLRK